MVHVVTPGQEQNDPDICEKEHSFIIIPVSNAKK